MCSALATEAGLQGQPHPCLLQGEFSPAWNEFVSAGKNTARAERQ